MLMFIGIGVFPAWMFTKREIWTVLASLPYHEIIKVMSHANFRLW